MIIDIHGHVSAPQGLYAYKSGLLASRGSHGRGGTRFSDEQIEQALNAKSVFGDGHLDQLKKHGTDLQLLSPRPAPSSRSASSPTASWCSIRQPRRLEPPQGRADSPAQR